MKPNVLKLAKMTTLARFVLACSWAFLSTLAVDPDPYEIYYTSPQPTSYPQKYEEDIKRMLPAMKATTVSIQTAGGAHVCTGGALNEVKVLTTCKCAHVFNYDTAKYELFDSSRHERLIVSGVDDLCNLKDPSRLTAWVFTARPSPLCRMPGVGDYFLNDVAILETHAAIVPVHLKISLQWVMYDRILHPFTWEGFIQEGINEDMPFFYVSWRSFFSRRTLNSVRVMNHIECRKLFLEREIDFPEELFFEPDNPRAGEQNYCTGNVTYPPIHRPCYGREGAMVFKPGHKLLPAMLMTDAGHCSGGQVPATFIALEKYYPWVYKQAMDKGELYYQDHAVLGVTETSAASVLESFSFVAVFSTGTLWALK